MAVSAAWSAAVTGSNWPLPLSVTLSAVRKNGRMVSPETEASSSTKAEKSMAVMVLSVDCDRSPPRPLPPAGWSGLQ